MKFSVSPSEVLIVAVLVGGVGAVAFDAQTLFISSVGDNKLVALDLRDGAQRTLSLSPAPYHLNTIRGTGKVYVSSRSDPVIWVVDQKSLTLTGTIKLPAGVGHQMAVMLR